MRAIEEYKEISEMDGFEIDVDQDSEIRDLVQTIMHASSNIARCKRIKEQCEKQLSSILEHAHEGQKTYERAGYKITVKASLTYDIKKELYEVLRASGALPVVYDPIKKSETITYRVNNEYLNRAKENASKEILDRINSFLIEKDRKVTINIGVE